MESEEPSEPGREKDGPDTESETGLKGTSQKTLYIVAWTSGEDSPGGNCETPPWQSIPPAIHTAIPISDFRTGSLQEPRVIASFYWLSHNGIQSLGKLSRNDEFHIQVD